MTDLKPETRALLDLGREGDDPTDQTVQRNRRSLALKLGVAALGTSALAASTSKAAAASLGTWTSAKVLTLCGAVLVGGAVTFGANHVLQADPPAPASGSLRARATEPITPSRPEPSSITQGEETAEQPVAAEVYSPKTPLPSPRSTTSSRAPAPRSIQDEFELVRAAQKHLHRNEPQAALAVLAEHARRFPSGALSEEREASRVFALCRMGNVAAARAQADRFIRRAPKSPFVDRVRASCRAPTRSGSQ